MKLNLHDGEKKIRTIGVVLYLRNTEEYLKTYLIPTLTKFEKLYDCIFYYYIFENDSTDDTVMLLNNFMKDRKGIFISKKLHLNTISNGSHISRIQRMVYVRNLLLDSVRHNLVKHDWCLFIDADIYFENNVLLKLMSKKPRLHNIGMLTCNTIQVNKINSTHESEDHYYDTFACISKEDIFTYPTCISADCKNPFCKSKQSKYPELTKIYNTNPIPLDVRSAWGGYVLIHASVFLSPNIRWKTLNLGDQAICEHIYLCDMIHGITSNRVVICGDITCYWVVE